MSFTVKVKEFEGPLDLLLNLIEKRKLHINDIALSQVADDYVQHIRGFQGVSMGDMANFILIASTLMLIKSHSLLPTLTLTTEEQASIEDLERRLKLYQKMKDLSLHIKDRYGKSPMYAREAAGKRSIVFAPTKEITKENILTAIKNVLNSLPKKQLIPQAIVKKVISLEEVITKLTERVQSAFKMRFSDFVGDYKQEKVSVIVSFLGMLELVKDGIIEVEQQAHFQDINMETKQTGVPRYS